MNKACSSTHNHDGKNITGPGIVRELKHVLMLNKSNKEYIHLIDTKDKQSSRAISEDHLMIVHWLS